MTVCIQKRDRCRLCFSLILRDRSTLFSSVCCQKYYHLFKHIKRTKIPIKKYNPFQVKLSTRTVCFRDLIVRYLRTRIDPDKNSSNFICYDCSMTLLDIEQCAKHLRRTVNQLKIKFNKSNRLITSSLFATFQKKSSTLKRFKTEHLSVTNVSDDDEEFDDIDDDDDDVDDNEDSDDDNIVKSSVSTSLASSNKSKSLDLTSSSLSSRNPLSNIQRMGTTNRDINNGQCNDDEDNEEDDDNDDDGDDDEEDEDDPIKNTETKSQKDKQKSSTSSKPKNTSSDMNSLSTNILDPMGSLLPETNPNMLQLCLARMMANAAAAASLSTGQLNNSGNNTDAMINTLFNMQRNVFMKMLSDPMAAAQVALTAAQVKPNMPSMGSNNNSNNNKQSSNISSGRKRKSTPEKRVITNYRPGKDKDDKSSKTEHESVTNSTDTKKHQEKIDHPLELTLKSHQPSSRVLSSTDVQNVGANRRKENASPSNAGPTYQHTDEDRKERTTPNDSSTPLSSSLIRHSTIAKRQRLSTSGQYDSTNTQNNNLSMMNITQAANDLTASNNHQTSANDDNNLSLQQRQQRKLDPRTCSECGKVVFTDKNLLLHCQTHAKNEKQCWICGAYDEAIKKHIINEHGNQKITSAGFKCQHCDKVYPVFADLVTHTKEHTKKKPFECSICNKRFGQQGNLSCHLRIHSGVKPFNCASCGKAFRHSNSLRRHARTVHSASRGLTTPSSLLLSNSTTSLPNDIKSETYDDVSSALLMPSDDGSSSTGGAPSPSISNAQIDSDSREPLGTN